MTTTVYALQSVLGTTDCQFVGDSSRQVGWSPDNEACSLWQQWTSLAARIDIDWNTGTEHCPDPPSSLGQITIERLSPANAVVRRFGLLDGYRRMMTVVVLLAALGSGAETRGDLAGAARIREKYLINKFARHPAHRWRLAPAPPDAIGWDDLMTGRAESIPLRRPADESVSRWYSIAPEHDVSAATYRLERAIVGWTTVEEHLVEDTVA